MKKTPSLFKRDYEGNRQVFDEVVEGSEWVQAGEGVATLKWDGTACLVDKGVIYKRYDAKTGRIPPLGFIPSQEAPDPETGHWPGWVAVDATSPSDRWHMEAFVNTNPTPDGTYELIGPKVQGNPYRLKLHRLEPHGRIKFEEEPPRTFAELRQWFEENPVEGIVWHHPDGRMVKIKCKDFGLSWPPK